jgi:hypothetical protein
MRTDWMGLNHSMIEVNKHEGGSKTLIYVA